MLLKFQSVVKWSVAWLVWLGLVSCVHGSSKTVESQLTAARENLRISEASVAQAEAKLESLRKTGQASSQLIKEYENYLERLRDITRENRRVVNKMEAAYNKYRPVSKIQHGQNTQDQEGVAEQRKGQEQIDDEVTTLDRELDESLETFDDLLLTEIEEIRAESASKMDDLDKEASKAAQRLREKGIDLETEEYDGKASEGSENVSEGESTPSETGAEVTKQDGASEAGEEISHIEKSTSPERSGTGGKGASQKQRHGDGTDDDIVARQLREAAEKETDPKLKEKLWQEYEKYKKGPR